jgi:hypothetical protein
MTLERPALGPGNRQSSSSSRKASNPLSLSGASFLEAVGRALNLGGQSGLLLRVLLAGLADKAASECTAAGLAAAIMMLEVPDAVALCSLPLSAHV